METRTSLGVPATIVVIIIAPCSILEDTLPAVGSSNTPVLVAGPAERRLSQVGAG